MTVDRSRPPISEEAPAFRSPRVVQGELEGGITLTQAPVASVPVSRISFSVAAGTHAESPGEMGLASLVAEMLTEGTTRLDGTALQDELDSLGATLGAGADADALTLSLVTLDAHLQRALGLLEEVILEARFDAGDFERVRRQRMVGLAQRRDHPDRVAADAWRRLCFGIDDPRGRPAGGTEANVAELTVEDARGFWRRALELGGLRVGVVGSLGQPAGDEARIPERLAAWAPRLAALASGAGPPRPPAEAVEEPPERTEVFLVDRPGSSQARVVVGHPAVAGTHPDMFKLHAANQSLGGSFTSRINLNLREDKGWTYGARSGFDGGLRPGSFRVQAAVHTEAAPDAVREVIAELALFQEGLREEEVEFTRRSLAQTLARQYESAGTKAVLVDHVGRYGWPPDYPARRRAWLGAMTRAELDGLVRRHLHPEKLHVLVVGDAARIGAGLAHLGYGDPQPLDDFGAPRPA